MSLSKQDVRDHCRQYFDLDVEDVPDSIIDRWTVEGWGRINRKTRTWPGFEDETTLAIISGTATYSAPLREVTSLWETTFDGTIDRIDKQEADRLYPPPIVSGRPRHWSLWEGSITVYPTPSANYTWRVVGYRDVVSPAGIDEDDAIDLPTEDAADVLMAWAMHRVCMHQDELDQAAMYQREFAEGLAVLNFDEQAVPTGTPIVLNSRSLVDNDPVEMRLPWR